MSRLGKQPIIVPEKTEVTLVDGLMTVKGPKGSLTRSFRPEIAIAIEGKTITVSKAVETPEAKALWGTYAAHIRNMIQGVNTPFEKKLILEGVGFKADAQATELNLALGFSHPVKLVYPEGITMKSEKNVMTITGIDKDLVGFFAAKIRSLKKPEPYKGKGIRYSDEVVRRKQGKKSS